MTKFRGFNNSVISVSNKRGLNRRQVKQVQRVIEKNKRLKNRYVPVLAQLTNAAGATPATTYFQELTIIPRLDDSVSRSEDQILLKSYNIKLGMGYMTNDAVPATTLLEQVTYRLIIVRSKQGPVLDILDPTGLSITGWQAQPDPDLYQVYTDELFSCSGAAVPGGVNISLGYLMHFYKSFKNKKVPHMIVAYNGTTTSTINNGIYMKIIPDPNATGLADIFQFQLEGFCHLKWFDKE